VISHVWHFSLLTLHLDFPIFAAIVIGSLAKFAPQQVTVLSKSRERNPQPEVPFSSYIK